MKWSLNLWINPWFSSWTEKSLLLSAICFLHVDIRAWLELDFYVQLGWMFYTFFFCLRRWLYLLTFRLVPLCSCWEELNWDKTSEMEKYINSHFASSARLLYLWNKLTKMWKYYSDFNDNECFIVGYLYFEVERRSFEQWILRWIKK